MLAAARASPESGRPIVGMLHPSIAQGARARSWPESAAMAGRHPPLHRMVARDIALRRLAQRACRDQEGGVLARTHVVDRTPAVAGAHAGMGGRRVVGQVGAAFGGHPRQARRAQASRARLPHGPPDRCAKSRQARSLRRSPHDARQPRFRSAAEPEPILSPSADRRPSRSRPSPARAFRPGRPPRHPPGAGSRPQARGCIRPPAALAYPSPSTLALPSHGAGA